jgi:hypothetical protein
MLLKTLPQLTKRALVLHKSQNITQYTIYEEENSNRSEIDKSIHIVLDSKNDTYSILLVDHHKIFKR